MYEANHAAVGLMCVLCCSVSEAMSVTDFRHGFKWCYGTADLGQGKFGAVRLAKHLECGEMVAVKMFNGAGAKAAALSEAGFLQRLGIPHDVRCVGLAAEDQDILLITEHFILGTLEAHSKSCGHHIHLELARHLQQPYHSTTV